MVETHYHLKNLSMLVLPFSLKHRTNLRYGSSQRCLGRFTPPRPAKERDVVNNFLFTKALTIWRIRGNESESSAKRLGHAREAGLEEKQVRCFLRPGLAFCILVAETLLPAIPGCAVLVA